MTKTVSIRCLDGTPEGVRQIELDTSQINALAIPRTKLQDIREIPGAQQPSMYLLLGEDELYVGECETLHKRLKGHLEKEFWGLAISTFSKSPTWLDRTKVQYLEYMAVQKAKQAKIMRLHNIQEPAEKTIDQFTVPRLEEVIDDTSFIMKSLGLLDPFTPHSDQQENPIWHVNVKQTQAKGQFNGDQFLVLAGSIIRKEGSEVLRKNSPRQHENRSSILKVHADRGDGTVMITRDIAFRSPNEAVVFALGRNANAWTSWKNNKSQTMDEVDRQ